MTETIEILEGTSSNCCKSPIHIRHTENGDNKISDPFCSKCGKFSRATLEELVKIKESLDIGELPSTLKGRGFG